MALRDRRYWPSVRPRWLDIGHVLFRVASVNKNAVKNVTRPIFSYLDQTSLVNKGFNIWPKEEFSCGTNAGNPERERLAHLARSNGYAVLARSIVNQNTSSNQRKIDRRCKRAWSGDLRLMLSINSKWKSKRMLAAYVPRMRNSTLEIRSLGTYFRPQWSFHL